MRPFSAIVIARWALVLITGALLPLRARAEVPADQVLAVFDGGRVEAGDLTARWLLTAFPAPQILSAIDASADSDPRTREEYLRGLAEEIRETSIDLLCLRRAEEEGWDEDPAFDLRAKIRFARAHEEPWLEAITHALPEPTEQDLAPLVPSTAEPGSAEEQRSARLIFLAAAETSPERATQRALAEEIMDRLGRGEDFAALAREHSDGPGWEQGGSIGPLRPDEALWPELAEAVFTAPPDGTPTLFEGQMGFYITAVESAERPRIPTDAERRAMAEERWRREEAQRRRQELLTQWRDELGFELHTAVQEPDDAVFTLEGRPYSLALMRQINPQLRPETLLTTANTAAAAEILCRRLDGVFPPEVVQRRLRAARALVARERWEADLTSEVSVSPEAIREYYEYAVGRGAYRTHPRRHILLCRVMPVSPGNPWTPAAAKLLRGLEAEAQRVRQAIAPLSTSPEAFARAVEELDAASPYAVEFLDMGWMENPPTYLGHAFHEMQAGAVSEVIAPMETVRLIYAAAEVTARRPLTFEEAAPQAESVVLARERGALIRRAQEQMLREAGWRSLIAGPPSEEEAQ